jgi:NAD(P)-dependent dehydrogenase (short-subunit alcohol dehydrogenase family)
MFDLRGQVILVTGSTRGIGRAVVERAAEAGARVVVSSRRAEACEEVAAAIRARGGEAVGIACNVGRREEIEALAKGALAAYGRVDVLVGNAAINPYYGPLAGIEDAAWDKIMAANVRANLWLVNLLAPQMAARGQGAVVLVSSVVGLRGCDTIGAYGVSKAAEIALARNLAVEWGPQGVRVNAVCPGIVKTDFAKALWENEAVMRSTMEALCLKRLGEPDDIAGAVLFLASPAARYATGAVLTVDGGLTASIRM